MTPEWLEEQLTKALNEIEELKDIISELLPMDELNECGACKRQGAPTSGIHEKTNELCFWHPYYDKARKVLGIE